MVKKRPSAELSAYKRFKQEYPKKILAFPTGDFFQVFNEDADIMSKLCGLNLTDYGPYRICGFPKFILHEYEEKLKKCGHSILTFQKLNEIKEQTEQSNQSIMENLETDKTINVDYFKHIAPEGQQENSYYWLNKNSGVLEQVNIMKIKFCLLTGQIIYSLKHLDKRIEVVAKENFESPFTLKLYKNECDYKLQNPLGTSCHFYLFYMVRELRGCFDSRPIAPTTHLITGYKLKDGEPVKVNALDYINEVCKTFNEKGDCTYSINYVEIPDFNHIYKNKELLFMFEKVAISDNDGTKRTTKAPMSILRLTKEQNVALEKFLTAWEELQSANVGLLFDRECYDFYAINTQKIKSLKSEEPTDDFDYYLENGTLRIDCLPETMSIKFNFDANFDHDCVSVLCELEKDALE